MSVRGFTLLELAVAMGLTLLLGAGAVSLALFVARASLAHPQAADEQQRMRAVVGQIAGWVARAGAGISGQGAGTGTLPVPVLYPQRRGVSSPDPDTSAFDDRITIVTGLEPSASSVLAVPMTRPDDPVLFDPAACPPGIPACGYAPGAHVLVTDQRASGEWFAVTAVAGSRLDRVPLALSNVYDPAFDTSLTAIEVRALVLDRATRQLRVASPGTDLPFVEGVADFSVRWFGDPRPPGGPRPPAGQSNCAIDAAGSPRLPVLPLTYGSWAELTPADLRDGPWCGASPWRYDADLLRVRAVRLALRLDRVVLPGPAPAGGADPVVEIDVSPRNLVRLP
jgi:hypothetical protein